MTDYRHLASDRLRLDEPEPKDAPELYALHSDPLSWRHAPHKRHTEPARADHLIARSRERFASDGLSYWCVREAPHGPIVGWGGVSVPRGHPWWNLTYRIAPAYWKRGYASEVAAMALMAAHKVDPDRPVLAFVASSNEASSRVLEKVGMQLVWTGRDPDLRNQSRLVFLDRTPDPATLAAIETKLGTRVAEA